MAQQQEAAHNSSTQTARYEQMERKIERLCREVFNNNEVNGPARYHGGRGSGGDHSSRYSRPFTHHPYVHPSRVDPRSASGDSRREAPNYRSRCSPQRHRSRSPVRSRGRSPTRHPFYSPARGHRHERRGTREDSSPRGCTHARSRSPKGYPGHPIGCFCHKCKPASPERSRGNKGSDRGGVVSERCSLRSSKPKEKSKDGGSRIPLSPIVNSSKVSKVVEDKSDEDSETDLPAGSYKFGRLQASRLEKCFYLMLYIDDFHFERKSALEWFGTLLYEKYGIADFCIKATRRANAFKLLFKHLHEMEQVWGVGSFTYAKEGEKHLAYVQSVQNDRGDYVASHFPVQVSIPDFDFDDISPTQLRLLLRPLGEVIFVNARNGLITVEVPVDKRLLENVKLFGAQTSIRLKYHNVPSAKEVSDAFARNWSFWRFKDPERKKLWEAATATGAGQKTCKKTLTRTDVSQETHRKPGLGALLDTMKKNRAPLETTKISTECLQLTAAEEEPHNDWENLNPKGDEEEEYEMTAEEQAAVEEAKITPITTQDKLIFAGAVDRFQALANGGEGSWDIWGADLKKGLPLESAIQSLTVEDEITPLVTPSTTGYLKSVANSHKRLKVLARMGSQRRKAASGLQQGRTHTGSQNTVEQECKASTEARAED